MPPNYRFEPRRQWPRPAEPEISGDLLQSIGVRWEIDVGVNERKKVCRTIDCGGCVRTFRRSTVTLAHPLQKNRLIAAVVKQVRILDLKRTLEEIVSYQLLLFASLAQKNRVERFHRRLGCEYQSSSKKSRSGNPSTSSKTGVPSNFRFGIPTAWILFSRTASPARNDDVSPVCLSTRCGDGADGMCRTAG